MKKLILTVCVLLPVQFALTGCASSDAFTRVPKDHLILHKKIAIISGFNTGNTSLMTKDLTKKISEELKKRSKFDVMTHEQIKQKLPQYPIDIVDFGFKDEKQRHSMAITRTAKDKIDAIQNTLKVDYIVMVWVDQMIHDPNRGCHSAIFGRISKDTNLAVNTRLFQYPGGYSIGFSAYYPSVNRGFFEDLDVTFGRLVNIGAREFVSKFMKETKSAKMKKKNN